MRKATYPTLMMLLAAGGCNFAPPHVQPPLPINQAYTDAGEEGTRPVATLGWQEYFTDPRLKALIGQALANNRDLAVSVARIEQARAQYRVQHSSLFPEVDANGTATRTRIPLNTAGFGDTLTGGSSANPAHVTYNQYNTQIAVTSFELDFWGRIRNQSEAARRQFLATIEGANAFRLSLIGDVASTYLSILAGEEGIALAREALRNRQEGLDIAKLRLDAGVTSTVDYDQAALLVTQAHTELADLQRTTAQSRNQLTVLVGGPMTQPLPQGLPIAQQGPLEDVAPGLPSSLLLARPDIRQAEQTLRASEADIGAARAAFFPTITLTGNYGFASTALDQLFKGPAQAWSFSGALNLPIFDWGRRKASLEAAKAARDEQVATYQKTVQTAFREVSDALVARQRYGEQIRAQEETVATQRRLADTARLRYQQGIELYLQVLDAERSLFSAQQALIQLRATALQNGVTLYVALGGGDDTVHRNGPAEAGPA
jgi:multidrug efflux system outer membrane protein